MGLKLYTESSGSNRKLNIKYVKLRWWDVSVVTSLTSLLQVNSLDVRSQPESFPRDQPGAALAGLPAAVRHGQLEAPPQPRHQPRGLCPVRCPPGTLGSCEYQFSLPTTDGIKRRIL